MTDVPLDGYKAFYEGWVERGNPHPKNSVERMTWFSEWWRANAEAFKSHIEGDIKEDALHSQAAGRGCRKPT